MTDELRVSVVETRGRLAVVALVGDLEMTTAADMYVQATGALAGHPDLIVDLSGVEFCDSSGFNALLRLRRRVEEDRGWLALAAVPAQIARLLALTGVDGVFAVYDSRADALAAHPDPGGPGSV